MNGQTGNSGPFPEVTHRDPVIFEIQSSFVFPPERGRFGMPSWRLTIQTHGFPDRYHNVLWVLSEVIPQHCKTQKGFQ